MKFAIILTNDWELYGNGQGDYFINQKEPLNSLLEIINSYQAKLTVFAEVVQQLNSLEKAPANEELRTVSSDWEKTISDLVEQGHDVQLHIHPQLIGDNLKDFNKWSIANFSKLEMLDIISTCKKYLENTLKKTYKDYNCIAFRAGGYAIQPSQIVIENLLITGIRCDSSVTKGLSGSFFDFKNSYSHYFPWFCKSDITLKTKKKGSLLEMPIYSIPKLDSPLLRVFLPTIFYRLFHSIKLSKEDRIWLNMNMNKNSGYSMKDKYSAQIKRSFFKFIFSKLIQRSSLQFDYDKIPAKILTNHIKKEWESINSGNFIKSELFKDCYIPIVLIGHAKELKSIYNIELLLKLLASEFTDNYDFFTISSFYTEFTSNSTKYNNLDKQLRSNGNL
jgi:hypothetical protein